MDSRLRNDELSQRFDAITAPHLDAAYNLARWLTRNPHDAEDIVQEAYLRAWRFFDGFRGGDGRAWLLKIVRNTFYSSLPGAAEAALSPHPDGVAALDEIADESALGSNPETLLLREAGRQQLEQQLLALPAEFREALVLRELEDLSYREIATITEVPIGTVMSRLSRARALLRTRMQAPAGAER